MKLNKFNIDAFNGNGFKGNPACVIPLKKWISDKTLLEIAKTNAVPETAFYVIEDNKIYLRWFTPEIEMDLCGHATLATAHCLYAHLGYKKKDNSLRNFKRKTKGAV